MLKSRLKIIAILLLALVIVGVFVWFFLLRSTGYKINVNQAAVVKEMRSLNRLETASFTIEKIIEAGTSGNAFNQFLFGDRILLIAHGEVVAGIDLSRLEEKDITIRGAELRIELPAPEILFVRLDNHLTRVYDRNQGILTKSNNDLESEARQAAEDEIRKAACQSNILDQASGNARKQLTALFSALGFTKIVLIIPEASC
jgi:Protein of unknown function (DUF4230)